jgi:hypothetical protein
MLVFPVEGGTIMNVVAFVSDRSQPPDERVWTGSWVKPVDQKIMLDNFADWNETPVNLLKVTVFPKGSKASSHMLPFSAHRKTSTMGFARAHSTRPVDGGPCDSPWRFSERFNIMLNSIADLSQAHAVRWWLSLGDRLLD